jgi:hypothetical protein
MRRSNADKSFFAKFSPQDRKIAVNLTTSSKGFKPKTEVNPTDKDIYYDEIIYYDGGDVEGYGDDK